MDSKTFSKRTSIMFSQNKDSIYLKIDNTQEEDLGAYECVASNSVETISEAVMIFHSKLKLYIRNLDLLLKENLNIQ